jgi:hypothetical protein
MWPCPVSTTARASEARSLSKRSARPSHRVMSRELPLPCRTVTAAIPSSILQIDHERFLVRVYWYVPNSLKLAVAARQTAACALIRCDPGGFALRAVSARRKTAWMRLEWVPRQPGYPPNVCGWKSVTAL